MKGHKCKYIADVYGEVCEFCGAPRKVYILKKDCSNIGKEVGDYYNGEYAESIEELLAKGVIEEEI